MKKRPRVIELDDYYGTILVRGHVSAEEYRDLMAELGGPDVEVVPVEHVRVRAMPCRCGGGHCCDYEDEPPGRRRRGAFDATREVRP